LEKETTIFTNMLALKGFKMQNVQKTYQTDVNRKENEANTMTIYFNE